ncbi:hypothetical protein ACT0ZX_000263 [Yersinia enterocolitica]|nr:hypothetical protein [Yersinia enterocolitica]
MPANDAHHQDVDLSRIQLPNWMGACYRLMTPLDAALAPRTILSSMSGVVNAE